MTLCFAHLGYCGLEEVRLGSAAFKPGAALAQLVEQRIRN
jgi:hypothetical protein